MYAMHRYLHLVGFEYGLLSFKYRSQKSLNKKVNLYRSGAYKINENILKVCNLIPRILWQATFYTFFIASIDISW